MADFMIEFEALAMKADTGKLHTIFLLKKIVQLDIIKIILGYPPIAAPETLNVIRRVCGQTLASIRVSRT